MKSIPSTTIKFKILENEYTATCPNNGEYLSIESMKHKLTDNKYNEISSNPDPASQRAKFDADMMSFFIICCPQVRDDLKIKSFSELDRLSSNKLVKVYLKTILPWLMNWDQVVNADLEEEEEKEKKETSA